MSGLHVGCSFVRFRQHSDSSAFHCVRYLQGSANLTPVYGCKVPWHDALEIYINHLKRQVMVSRGTSDFQEGLPGRRWTRGWCHLGKDLSIDLGASRQLYIIKAKGQRAISTIHRSLTTQQHIIFMFRQEPCLPNKCLRLVHVCLTFAKTRCWVPHWRLGYYIGGLLLKIPGSRLIVYSSEATSTLVLTMYVFILSSSVVWRWLRVAVRLWESLQVFRYKRPAKLLTATFIEAR